MGILKEQCHCGHDITSHYLDQDVRPAKRGSCLAMYCECKRYVNKFDPLPKARVKRPQHAYQCQCSACKEWEAQFDIKTDPIPWGTP